MKLNYTLVALTFAATKTVQACVTAHVYLNSCLIGGDILTAQVFDNGVKVCEGSKSTNLGGSNTVWCISGCQPGSSFCATNNGRSATYTSPIGNVVSMDIDGPGTHNRRFQCGGTDERKIFGTEFESCLVGASSDCGSRARCQFCDYRNRC